MSPGLTFASNHFIFGWHRLRCRLLDCCLKGTLLHVVMSLGCPLDLPLLPITLYLVGTSSDAVCWTAALKAYTTSCSNVTQMSPGLTFASNHFIFGWHRLRCRLLDCCLKGTLLHVVMSLGCPLDLPLLPITLYLVGTSSDAVCWTAALKAYTASCSNAGEGNSWNKEVLTQALEDWPIKHFKWKTKDLRTVFWVQNFKCLWFWYNIKIHFYCPFLFT